MPATSVSFVINSFNYAEFVCRAVESAIGQDYPQKLIEIVVVDDGSSDDTRARLVPYAKRVRYIHKTNGGQGSAFNLGFREASGDVLCMLDADDEALPQRAQNVVRQFQESDHCVAVYNRFILEDVASGQATGPHPRRLNTEGLRERVQVWRGSGVPSSCISLRSSIARKIIVPEATFRICADSYLLSVLPLLGRVSHVDDALTVYRLHGGNRYLSQPRDARRQMLETRMSAIARDMREIYRAEPYMAPLEVPLHARQRDLKGCLSALAYGFRDIWKRQISMNIKLKESVKLPLYALEGLRRPA